MRILVGIDFSRASDAAVREVAERPWPPGTLVRLLQIMEPLDFAANQVFVKKYVRTRAEAAQERILAMFISRVKRSKNINDAWNIFVFCID